MKSEQRNERVSGGATSLAVLLGGLVSIVILATVGLSCKKDQTRVDAGVLLFDGSVGPTCDAEPNKFRPIDMTVNAMDDAGTKTNLFSIWGHDENAMWAVGSGGSVLHYDGESWKRQETPTDVQLTSVWGTSDKDVWAVGYDGVIIHFDGTSWSEVVVPDETFVDDVPDAGLPTGDAAENWRKNLWGVWALGAEDETKVLYAVGDRGTVLFYDGTTKVWSKVQTDIEEKLTAVWGTSSRAYVVGDFGTVLMGSAKAGLAPQQTSVNKALRAVWGRNNNDVYAVGLSGTILHYNGTKWTPVKKGEGGAPPQVLRAIWGPPGGRVTYIAGWDGMLLRMIGKPPEVTFDLFNCVSANRLEAMWGTMVPGPPPEAGMPDLGGADMDIPKIPALWIVGVSETIISGP